MTEVGRLASLCGELGLGNPVYDLETVLDSTTACCLLGQAKTTASRTGAGEAREAAATIMRARVSVAADLVQFRPGPQSLHLREEGMEESRGRAGLSMTDFCKSQAAATAIVPTVKSGQSCCAALQELCELGLAGPLYDTEAVGGDWVTVCCVAGGIKQTGTAATKDQARDIAAAKTLNILHIELQKCIAPVT